MNELFLILFFGAVLVLGILVGRAPWLPMRCTVCGRWMRRDHMRMAEHRIGGWRRICTPCYLWLYGPEGRV
jgi:hypothetical protein